MKATVRNKTFCLKSETEQGPVLMQNQHTKELISAWNT